MNGPELATLNTDGDLTRLTLRRAPLNFLNLEMLRRIQELLDFLGDSPPGRVLVVESDCGAFCAGLEMAEQTKDTAFLLMDQYHAVVRTLNSFPRPTIAVVRGVALGAGNEIVACCDFALASLQATFGQPEIRVGIMPSLAPLLLPQRIGVQRSLHMILTGNPVNAEEAERIGLIYRALPNQALDAALENLVSSFRASSPAVMELALRSARGVRTRELEHNLREAQSLYLNDLMDLEDPMEGIRAFLEKRAPQWKKQ
jgi:enoyl-CoA hydratase